MQSYPNVLQAMARPIGYDFDPSFQAFYEETALKCGRAMRQDEPALILQAEPAVAIEAAAASLISADDVVLNLASGVYGKGFGYWSARYHKSMVEIEVPFNDAISPAAVEAALRDHPEISVVSVVHHDTPSGTLNPIVDIGRLVADHVRSSSSMRSPRSAAWTSTPRTAMRISSSRVRESAWAARRASRSSQSLRRPGNTWKAIPPRHAPRR